MKRALMSFVATGSLLVNAILLDNVAGGDPETFRKDYIVAAKKLQQQLSNFRATGMLEFSDYFATVEHLVLDANFQYTMQYPEDRQNIPGLKNHPDFIVRSKSKDTSFILGRVDSESGYYITALGDAAAEQIERKHSSVIAPATIAATHVCTLSLPEVIEDDRVEIDNFEVVSSDGKTLVFVELDLTKLDKYLTRAKIWFRGDLDLAVDHYELQSKVIQGNTERIFGRVEYGETVEGRSCIPKSVEIFVEGTKESPHRLLNRWTLAEISFDSITPEMFTLEHFGLGNRDLVSEQSRGWPWFTIISVLVFAASSGYLYWHRAKV